jgi:hypothetical protein
MDKRLRLRIRDAFENEESSYADEFAESIRANLRDLSNVLTRTTLLALGLCAVFELLSRAGTKVEFGGIEISDTALVQKLLPVAISYLFYEQGILSLKWTDLVTTNEELTDRFHRGVRENEIDTFLYPRLLAFWDFEKVSRKTYHPVERFDAAVTSTLVVLALAVPVIFEAYAFFRLFTQFGGRDIVLWPSLLVSGLLVVAIFVNIVLTYRGS